MDKNIDILSNLKDENLFSVPENYFDDFQHNLDLKIDNQSNGNLAKISFWKNSIAWLSVASVVVVALVSTLFFTNKSENQIQATNETYENILDENSVLYTQLDDETMIDFLMSEE